MQGKLDTTEEVLKRLLYNVEAFKRLENDNRRLEAILLRNQEIKKSELKRNAELGSIDAKKREFLVRKNAKEIIDKFTKINDVLIKEISIERGKNSFLSKKYTELSGIAKKLNYDNKLMKAVLMKNRSERIKMTDRMEAASKKLQEKHEIIKYSYKDLLKTHELTKLETDKKLAVQKERGEFIEKKYYALIDAFDRAKNDYNKARRMNEALIKRLSLMAKQSLANEKVLSARTEMIKVFFDKKLADITKSQINKEIDYKTRMESMAKDMAKYYEELKNSKEKYFRREKEIREKIKEIFN